MIALGAMAACGDTAPSTPVDADIDGAPIADTGTGDAVVDDATPEPDPGPVIPPPDCVEDQECGDDNPCTADRCAKGVCKNTPNTLQCDDGDPCTLGDTCVDGACLSTLLECDDANLCTTETCVDGACVYVAEDAPACALSIVITVPDRAASLSGDGPFYVSGQVTSPAADVLSLRLNGAPAPVFADDSFQMLVEPHIGINILHMEVTDVLGRAASTAQSFAYSPTLILPGTPAQIPLMDDVTAAWMSPEAFDDDDPEDLDDLASLIWLVLDTYDINAAIPHPLTTEMDEPSFGWCSWEIDLTDLQYTVSNVDLVPKAGGMNLSASMTNVSTHASAVASWCPDAKGDVTAEAIELDASVDVWITGSNTVQVSLDSLNVTITGVEIDIQEGSAKLFNWLLDWFEDDLAVLLATELEVWATENLTPLLNGVLSGLTDYTINFAIPPVLGQDSALPMSIRVKPESADFNDYGGGFALDAGLATEKVTSLAGIGSIARSQCGSTLPEKLTLPKVSPLETGLHEDLLNQFLFAVWWGGHTGIVLEFDVLEPYIQVFGITDAHVTLEPWLAPVITTCTEHGGAEAQLGDVRVTANFQLGAKPAFVDLYASARARVSFYVVEEEDGPNHIGLALEQVEQLVIDVMDIKGLGPEEEAVVEALLSDAMMDVYIAQFLSDLAGAYPLPNIDLSELLPNVDLPKPHLTFHMQTLTTDAGYVVIGGQVLND